MAAYEAGACTAEPFPLDPRLGLQNRQVESAGMVAEMPFQQDVDVPKRDPSDPIWRFY